jgi:flagellar FliL protein
MDEDDDREFDNGDIRRRKRLIVVSVASVVFVTAVALATYLTGAATALVAMVSGRPAAVIDDTIGTTVPAAAEAKAVPEIQPAVFYDLPAMLVNINTPGRVRHFLKIAITVELGSEDDVGKIEKVMPRIVDNFQIYLRGLTLNDLQGAAGMFRVREEFLTRITAATRPTRIKDVLFKEMIVQ